MKGFADKVSNAIDRYEERTLIPMGVWFWSAFIGMFFEKRFPFLHLFILWTFRIYIGMFVLFIIGLLVIAPGVVMAKDLQDDLLDPKASRFEQRLTRLWCLGAGVLLTLVIAAAYSSEIWGRVTDIKVWFIALCWMVVMVPYAVLGYLVRRFLHRNKEGRAK